MFSAVNLHIAKNNKLKKFALHSQPGKNILSRGAPFGQQHLFT